jgi:hypothetical protein
MRGDILVLEALMWVFPIDLGFPIFYANAKAILLENSMSLLIEIFLKSHDSP